MSRLRIIVTTILLFLFVPNAFADDIKQVKPEKVGLSSERLARLDRTMQKYADDGILPGAVILIARHGKIAHLSAVGMMDVESGKPMRTDVIFRLYSMTKPITSVALLTLYEEGLFQLTDFAELHIPSFKDLKVFEGVNDNGELILADQKRKMSIQDIFRHTGGLSYGSEGTPIDKIYQDAGIEGLYTLKELVVRLGKAPLLYQPGARYVYSFSHDVQAYLVEHFSGMPFDKFLWERITEPLGMTDTSFGLEKDKYDRLTTMYGPVKEEQTGLIFSMPEPGIKPVDKLPDSEYLKLKDYPAGGNGLLTTAEDYFRFAQMLINGGTYKGKRILGRKTVELMTQNHLPPGTDAAGGLPPGPGYGLGVSVLTDLATSGNLGSEGQFGWGGYGGTTVIIDPAEGMISILLTQRGPAIVPIWHQFQTLVYQAVID